MNKLLKNLLSIFVIGIFVFFAFASGDGEDTATSETAANKIIPLDSVLTTEYFEIQVNKVSIKKSVITGNQYANIKQEQGNKFLIFNITFKNIDDESRTFYEGEIIIDYKGKDYRFDKSETVLADGWGTFLDQINPLTTKTTNLVFKIPDEINGKIYWEPGRNSKGKMFLLKEIEAQN